MVVATTAVAVAIVVMATLTLTSYCALGTLEWLIPIILRTTLWSRSYYHLYLQIRKLSSSCWPYRFGFSLALDPSTNKYSDVNFPEGQWFRAGQKPWAGISTDRMMTWENGSREPLPDFSMWAFLGNTDSRFMILAFLCEHALASNKISPCSRAFFSAPFLIQSSRFLLPLNYHDICINLTCLSSIHELSSHCFVG